MLRVCASRHMRDEHVEHAPRVDVAREMATAAEDRQRPALNGARLMPPVRLRHDAVGVALEEVHRHSDVLEAEAPVP